MTLIPSTAASAVYHDALTVARGWRNLCFLILLLILLLQLGLFLTARFTDGIIPVAGSQAQQTGEVNVPSGVETQEGVELEREPDGSVEAERDRDLALTTTGVDAERMKDWLYMLLYFTLWGGLVFSILLTLTLLFTTLVMLNGRTVGVSREMGAFFWSLLLLLLLIPWQAILNHPTLVAGERFHIPGVLYTWDELYQNGKAFQDRPDWLGWMRFVVWPVVALLILLVVQSKARRGVKEALGEDLAMTDEPLRDRPLA